MIIFRYLVKQVMSSTLAVSFALLMIVFSGRFVKYLAQVASGEISGDILWQVMFYRMPGFLELILPLGFFLSLILVYGRMYIDSEMTALFAGGMSRNYIFFINGLMSVFMLFVVLVITTLITPVGLQKFDELWKNPENFRGLSTLIEGRFQKNRGTPWVSYTERLNVDKTAMENVFLAHIDQDSDHSSTLVIADRGRIVEENKGRYIEFEDGYRYEGKPGSLEFQITKFDRFGQLIRESTRTNTVNQPEVLSTKQLWVSGEREQLAIFHWRIGVPLSVPIMSLIALSLSKTDYRRGRFFKLIPALILYLLYVFLLGAAKNMLAEGSIPMILGCWWLHFIFLSIALSLWFWPTLQKQFFSFKKM
jgi:lipopolysaccharide export system permease protein